MSRVANPLTATQQDDALFVLFREEIKRIGVRKLGSYGKLSHETINNYCRRMPVSATTEELIRESIRVYRDELAQTGEVEKNKTRQVLAA